jgi:hypothetical protein
VYALGETDTFGNLTVSKVILGEHQARVILFSHEGFFTAAIVVEKPGPSFYAFDEQYIELAPVAVI